MNTPRVIAAVLWLLGIAEGVRQGLSLPNQAPVQGAFGTFGVMALLLPIIFFSSAPFWMKGHPFDLKPARVWINKKYGDNTYENYTRAIKPLALFAAVAASIGLVGLVASISSSAAPGAYVLFGFFLSCSIGFTVFRLLLRRQGNTIE